MRIPPFKLIAAVYREHRVPRLNVTPPDGDQPTDALTAYMRGLMIRDLTTPTTVRDEPIDRFWPALSQDRIVDRARFSARHPDLTWALNDIPTQKRRAPRAIYAGRRGKIHTMKTQRTIFAASRLEREGIRQCEVDDNVLGLVEQPITVHYRMDGKLRRYTPDLYVMFRSGRGEFQEHKFEAEASLASNAARWPLIGLAFGSSGQSFRVVTERHLQVRKANTDIIWKARQAHLPDASTLDEVRSVFASRGNLTLAQLLAECRAVTRRQALALIRRSFLAVVDLDLPIDPDGLLRLGSGLMTWTGAGMEDDL